jgi:Lysine methyltransferase
MIMIKDEENDDFWMIAMDDRTGREGYVRWDVGDNEGEDDVDDSAKTTSYRIPSMISEDRDSGTVTLKLRPLPPTDGIWSPVGADAWYASALLAALLIQKDTHNATFRHPFSNVFSLESNNDEVREGCNVIVELGSGAVGLSGFVCALALDDLIHRIDGKVSRQAQEWKILMTDNDVPVLEQLGRNLQANQPPLKGVSSAAVSSTKDRCQVEIAFWDWEEDQPAQGLQPKDNVVLVVGSELVYTKETADACVGLLLRLLRTYPDVEIWNVQVSDRYGWWEIVVPVLQQNEIHVDKVPIAPEVHDMAMDMVQMGGTLDRYAYGAFCIHR